MPQQFDPNEFAPKKRTFKSTDESKLKGSGGYTRGLFDSAVPDYNPLYTPETLPSFPVRAAKEIGHDIISGLASPFGAVTEGMAGLGLPFALRGAASLIKKFRGKAPNLPPVRNVEAPVAELPPVKPELLDDSGRMVAPPQPELPVRPNGPWNENVPEVPIKPELNKPLPSLPIEDGESIGAYLRRNGVDNIHTTPGEQVANRAAQVPDNGPVVPINKEVSAKYVFDQPTPEGGTIPMYNIEGGPLHGTTVSAQTLDDMGLPVPEKTAPMQKPLTLEERQAAEPPTIPINTAEAPEVPIKTKMIPPVVQGTPELMNPSAQIWYQQLADLDTHNAPDIEYRNILSTGAEQPLKKGETWRGRVEKYINLKEESTSNFALEKEPPFDPASLGFEGAAKQFDEAEFVNPTTGEIIPESMAGQGDVPLNAPPAVPGIAGRSATKRMGSPDLGLEGVPEVPPVKPPSTPNIADYDEWIEQSLRDYESSNIQGGLRKPGDPEKVIIPEIGMTEADIDDLLNIRHNQARNEAMSTAFPGAKFNDEFLEKFPELKGKTIKNVEGWNEGAVSVTTTDGKHMVVGREDITGLDIPSGRDYKNSAVPEQKTVMSPDRFDDQGNFIPQTEPHPMVARLEAGRIKYNLPPRAPQPSATFTPPPNAAEMPPIQQPQPDTLNTNALSQPAMLDEPWTPVGSLPNEQIPLMDVKPQIPFQPAGVPRPPTPYQPAGVMPRLGPPKPKAPMLGPQPPPPPVPPTPYQPAGIPKQLGPQPPKQPPMGPRKPPQPPANPLVPPPPPPTGPIRAALGAHKAWLTSLDLSAPGRQGKAFIFNKAWWTSLDDMGKAWWSKQGSDAVNDSIDNHASGFFKQTQLPNGRKVQSWAEQMGLELPKHEEMFNNTAGKKFAEMTGIEKSSRAHTAFLNKLRSDQFASMIEASQKAGIDPIKNQNVARSYAKFINDATGRGSLNFGSWKLERNMQVMNDTFFAAKNMSGQIRTWNNVLNPAKYYSYDPVLRKQALKSLFAVAGVGLGVGEVARMAGAQVSNDPTSADFRKVKIGDTRIDMFGGYQQFPVAAMKLLIGESTSTISGRTTDLTAGRYGQQTRGSVAQRFFVNRLSPVGSFIWAWMWNSEFDGKPFEVKRALFERTFPIAAKDIMELAQEDPALAAIMAPTTVTGLTGTQHYTGR